MRKINKAAAVILAFAMLFAAALPCCAFAEEEGGANGIFNGTGAELSGYPVEMYPIAAFRVDIDPGFVERNDMIEMEFQMLAMPYNLINAVLWDGWHMAYGSFELDWARNTVTVRFAGSSLKDFYRLEHLYLCLMGSAIGAN